MGSCCSSCDPNDSVEPSEVEPLLQSSRSTSSTRAAVSATVCSQPPSASSAYENVGGEADVTDDAPHPATHDELSRKPADRWVVGGSYVDETAVEKAPDAAKTVTDPSQTSGDPDRRSLDAAAVVVERRLSAEGQEELVDVKEVDGVRSDVVWGTDAAGVVPESGANNEGDLLTGDPHDELHGQVSALRAELQHQTDKVEVVTKGHPRLVLEQPSTESIVVPFSAEASSLEIIVEPGIPGQSSQSADERHEILHSHNAGGNLPVDVLHEKETSEHVIDDNEEQQNPSVSVVETEVSVRLEDAATASEAREANEATAEHENVDSTIRETDGGQEPKPSELSVAEIDKAPHAVADVVDEGNIEQAAEHESMQEDSKQESESAELGGAEVGETDGVSEDAGKSEQGEHSDDATRHENIHEGYKEDSSKSMEQSSTKVDDTCRDEQEQLEQSGGDASTQLQEGVEDDRPEGTSGVPRSPGVVEPGVDNPKPAGNQAGCGSETAPPPDAAPDSVNFTG